MSNLGRKVEVKHYGLRITTYTTSGREMTLFVDDNPRSIHDHYTLYGTTGKQILHLSFIKLKHVFGPVPYMIPSRRQGAK